MNNIWVYKYRPKSLDDIVLSDDVKKIVKKINDEKDLNHLLLYGPAGTGKTSLAKLLVHDVLGVSSYLYINASDERGIDVIRDKIKSFSQTRSIDGKIKVVLLDECCGLTGDALRALRNTMEEYIEHVRFILTANYTNRISVPIKSRVIQIEVLPPIDGCLRKCVEVLKLEGVKVPKDQIPNVKELIKYNYPDLRTMLNTLQLNVSDGVLNINKISSNDIIAYDILLILRTQLISAMTMVFYIRCCSTLCMN